MTTSASLQSPIDEENIQIEEVPSSSSNNVTANSSSSSSSSSVDAINVKRDITSIRVKKEEEEVDDEDKSHNDGTRAMESTGTSNQNYELNRSVKKEEEVENNDDEDIKITCKEMDAQCDDDYDYSGWKAGDWCWVLPADKNTQQLTSRSIKSVDGGNNTSTSTAVISVNNTITNDSSSPSSIRSRTTRETKTKRSTRSIDDKTAAAAADEASSRPKKKKRTNDDASSGNNNSNTTKQKEEYIEERDSHENTDVSSTVDNGVDSNSSNDVDDDDCNEHLFEESNSDKGDGYESWTKGNWCWLLPRLHSVDKINETEQHSYVICGTERTAITRSRSSRRRGRRNPSSSAHVEVGGENENKLDEDYVERDDEDDNGHNSSRRTKTGSNTMRYTKKQNERWNEKFQGLVTYKKEYNSTSVPYPYKEDPKLGSWVVCQRSHYNNSKLSETRAGCLDSIGFAWNPNGEKWMEMYHKLVAYKKSHRSTRVPRHYVEDRELGSWVSDQRVYYKNKALSTERTHCLESIGFVWDSHDAQWMGKYQKLVAYKKQYGSTKVSRHYTEDPQLGQWVSNQRKNCRKKKLTEKRTELLNSISFAWSL